eukprot:206841-Rhodomonas_salina.1
MHTFMSVKGNRRGGGVEIAYASFLSSGIAATQVLKKSILKKKSSASPPSSCQKRWFEQWNDRHVTLRGNFIIVGKVNHEAQSKVHMISGVSDESNECFSFSVTSNKGKLYFRAKTLQEKDQWVQTIRDVLEHADSLPHMEDHKSELQRSNSAVEERSRFASDSSTVHSITRSHSASESEGALSGAPSRTTSAGAEDFQLLERSAKSERRGLPQVDVPPGPSLKTDHAVEIGRNEQAHASMRSVGVFWDTTTVVHPTEMGQEAAMRKVREFAKQHGHTKVFKLYSEEEKGKSVRKRMDKDMIIWLWDEAKKAADGSVIILISDRAFLSTLKEFAVRGATVIVVNSRMDKTVAVAAAAAIEYKRSTRTLWETEDAATPEEDAARTTRSEQDLSSDDSDADSLSCSSGSACAAPLTSPHASPKSQPVSCPLEAPLAELQLATKRPVFATSLLVLANVVLAVLLIWSS